MKIFGKEIKPEVISLWLNILGFIVGILFYIRLERKNSPVVPVTNPVHDSVMVIDTRLSQRVQELKTTQDSLIHELRIGRTALANEKDSVNVIRRQIHVTLNSDWDSMDARSRKAYLNRVMSNLQKQNSK